MAATSDEADAGAPDGVAEFRRGIGSLLRQWTVLHLAVTHGWGCGGRRQVAAGAEEGHEDEYYAGVGGGGSGRRRRRETGEEKAARLEQELIVLLMPELDEAYQQQLAEHQAKNRRVRKPKRVFADEVEDFLTGFMDSEFHTVAEDGSIEEISAIALMLRDECERGEFARVEMLLEREPEVKRVLEAHMRANAGADDDEEEDDDGDEEEYEDEDEDEDEEEEEAPRLQPQSALLDTVPETAAETETEARAQQLQQQQQGADGAPLPTPPTATSTAPVDGAEGTEATATGEAGGSGAEENVGADDDGWEVVTRKQRKKKNKGGKKR